MGHPLERSTASNNFFRYECKSDGDLETNIQGSFSLISDWPYLHHIAIKVGLGLTWEHPANQNLMDCGNTLTPFECKHSNTTKVFATSQRLRPEIIDKQIYEKLSHAKELRVQGRLLDNIDAEYLLSQNIFRNCKLSDNRFQFWYKARHNVISCNYTLSIWYPQQSPFCRIDSYSLDSMAHNLNGCRELKK